MLNYCNSTAWLIYVTYFSHPHESQPFSNSASEKVCTAQLLARFLIATSSSGESERISKNASANSAGVVA